MKRKDDRGFTLVELIVVLVILAILAAILVPALLGYIDEAKKKQYLLDAKNLFNATQAELSKIYAVRGEYKTDRVTQDKTANNVVENGRGLNSAMAWLQDYAFPRDVFKLAGYKLTDSHPEYSWYQKLPGTSNTGFWNVSADSDRDNCSFFCIGIGDYDYYLDPKKKNDPHKAYTAYLMIYQPYEGADFYLFDGTSFIDSWPFNYSFLSAKSGNKGKYILDVNGENIPIQFLVLKSLDNKRQVPDSELKKIDEMYFNK
ncbi:MAG: type II secretion system protein [Lachnospiraceae bacterium]|nr:type II secretion system protein [Lachnospiraceae bacterium]MBQ6024293.1 type II secretion system protein [Lachnospiraceae bacterium]